MAPTVKLALVSRSKKEKGSATTYCQLDDSDDDDAAAADDDDAAAAADDDERLIA